MKDSQLSLSLKLSASLAQHKELKIITKKNKGSAVLHCVIIAYCDGRGSYWGAETATDSLWRVKWWQTRISDKINQSGLS